MKKISYKNFKGQKAMFDMVKNSLREGEHFWERAANMEERFYRKHGVTCFHVRFDTGRRIMKTYYPEWAKANGYIT